MEIEEFHYNTEVSSFLGLRIPLYSDMSGGWNRGVPLYTEVSSFQGVGIVEFHCINRGVLISGSWNRGVPLYTEVSSFQVGGTEEVHCIQRCPTPKGWARGFPLYTGAVSSFQRVIII